MVDARHCLSGLLVAVAAGAASLPVAAARQNSHPTKPAEVATRGQREAKDISYGDWRKLCFKAGGAKTLCRGPQYRQELL